ncbi:3-oxoacyl-ACP synthase III family protein [Micromonospora lupini]|uniref:3-oxoacyl-ACP synthase III family protein n=1 Tax=Micromonospora lupini TaxID=285679 RepID=UPI00225BA1B3|nr:3-oxoacyl-ACP synthase III family protein [Micromonospora lupini]MCX5065763.1 3-oxoacyl-ACP synthase III family protein [Micromonospora lupini]
MSAPDVYLRSVGSALPGERIDNAMLARRFGQNRLWEQWVAMFVGTSSRYLAVDLDTAEVRFSLADLGETAAHAALSRAGITAQDVDVVVLGTATPDQLMPATVNLIADRLGINDVPTYQMQSGCTGALQALDVARQLIASGRHHTVLVLGGDVCAKHFDLSVEFGDRSPGEQINALLFGDGAGAAVLSAEPGPGKQVVVRDLFVRFTGLGRPPGQTVEWFGLADRGADRPGAFEDYKAIELGVPVLAVEILDELLDRTGWAKDELDVVFPPQLSGRMTQTIVKEMGLAPATREVSCVAQTGNNGNALPFLQLEQGLDELAPGSRSVLVAVESSKWIKAGLALEVAYSKG